MVNKDQKGSDASLIVAGQRVPVTEKEWGENRDIASSQFDDSINPRKSLVTQDFEGTFSFDGSNREFQEAIRTDEGEPVEDLRLIIKEDAPDGGYRFNGVEISSVTKNYPSDGKASVDVDWEAETMVPF